MPLSLQLEESDRQAILLAIGHLAVDRPGWHHYLREVAAKLHGVEMFDEFHWQKTGIKILRERHGADAGV